MNKFEFFWGAVSSQAMLGLCGADYPTDKYSVPMRRHCTSRLVIKVPDRPQIHVALCLMPCWSKSGCSQLTPLSSSEKDFYITDNWLRRKKTNMNTNQVRPHLTFTVNLWDGHFYAHFSVMRQYTQDRAVNCLQRSFSPLGCKAPGGVTTSKIFNKNVPSQEALHCFFGGVGGITWAF